MSKKITAEEYRYVTKEKLLDLYNKYSNMKNTQKRAAVILEEIKRRKLPVTTWYGHDGKMYLTWSIWQFNKKKTP